ncbi:MAG: Rieske 2Fe-2S domain-containing protein [Armatimonadetes bacterium]|nr:Rieske 2Fe-2S domain-containing protein [Armatimonadota bacterium]
MPRIYEVDEDIRNASTLPGAYYHDLDAYNRGKEAYFANSWQLVGDTDLIRVPGQVYPFEFMPGFLPEPLLFTRDTEDQVHLCSNVCTHRGMQVCEGPGNERFLRCRYHGRRFGLDGKFKSMPEFEDVCNFPTDADNLTQVPFHAWSRFLFASLQPAAPFEEVFGPILERLAWLPLDEFRHDPANSRDYLVKSHWALYVDNYLEGFHIPFVHTALNDILEYDSYHTERFAWGNLQLAEAKGGEGIFDLPTSSPDHGRRIAAYYYWIFPNLMLNFYPWGLSINVVRPTGIDTTKVSFIRYVWREELLGVGAGAEIDRVEREDEQVVELVQKGLRSRFYGRGRFSPQREIGTHQFHRMLAQRLNA